MNLLAHVPPTGLEVGLTRASLKGPPIPCCVLFSPDRPSDLDSLFYIHFTTAEFCSFLTTDINLKSRTIKFISEKES